ncbi:MAG: DPP IV N-terminal domain-containing protein [Chloroflexota bacterium]
MIFSQSPIPDQEPEASPRRFSLTLRGWLLLLLGNLIILTLVFWPTVGARWIKPSLDADVPPMAEINPGVITPSLTATPTNAPSPTATSTATPMIPAAQPGLLILSLQEGHHHHLFAYRPMVEQREDILPLTRLTAGSWDDTDPALSPDGKRIAFSSNRDGQWDLYSWDLSTSKISRLTKTPEFESSPSWSPDSTWLAYTRYLDNNLELFIEQIDSNGEPIQLTQHLAADHSPAWSPLGRQIAFVSTRSGRAQIWLANLDQSGDQRFTMISESSDRTAKYPAWSPDGRYLAWAAVTEHGLHRLMIWDSTDSGALPVEHGSGDRPVWSQDGRTLFTTLEMPSQTYFTAYPFEHPDLIALPPVALPGTVDGLICADLSLVALLPELEAPVLTPFWEPEAKINPDSPGDRWGLVLLDGVEAPYAQLHDRVNESFTALQQYLASQIGWDALASLENAYLPLTSVLSPGQRGDWLYTGRAFALNTLPINAGWMMVVREDYGPETYWRIYYRARFQDGSKGQPLQDIPWDFSARYRSEPRSYEQGGEYAQTVPPGYWFDLTSIARTYGWERLPALATWRSAYAAARFNEFFRSDDLTWEAAMLEIYPPEVMVTPTIIATATPTPTLTPYGYRTPTPGASSSPTPTATAIPTQTSTAAP